MYLFEKLKKKYFKFFCWLFKKKNSSFFIDSFELKAKYKIYLYKKKNYKKFNGDFDFFVLFTTKKKICRTRTNFLFFFQL